MAKESTTRKTTVKSSTKSSKPKRKRPDDLLNTVVATTDNGLEIVEEDASTIFNEDTYNQGISQKDVIVYTKDRVVLYGVNVSVFRACSALFDGLTPVRRRILYTMYAEQPRLLPSDDYHKVAEWLGGVAKYHPHGSLTIENTFSSMIKEWETNACLIDLSGNGGSLTGEDSAATRYLDAKMSLYAYKCFFEEFEPDSIEMVDNYLRSAKEPVVLPAKYPNFLLGVATGIAWGNSMDLIPFNLVEAFELTKALIHEPDMTNVYLYPDSPRGYDVIDDGTIQSVCNAGHGSIKVRAVLKAKQDTNGTVFIEVTGYPEGVSQDDVEKKIVKLVEEKKVLGIIDTADKSTLEQTKLRLILKPGTDPEQVIHQLYSNKSSGLTGHADIEFNFAERTSMIHLGLKDAILEWVDRRIDYKQRYYMRRLSKLDERIHQLEGLLAIIEDKKASRKATDLVYDAENEDEVVKNLIKDFKVSSYQAKRISEMSLTSLNANRRDKILKELEKIPKEIHEIERILSSRKNIEDKICEELDEGIALFGKPRCCNIISVNDTKSTYEMKYRLLVTGTHIKKMVTGGKALGILPQDDLIGYYPEVGENDKIYLLTEAGRIYSVALSKIAPTDAAHRGQNIFDLLGVSAKVIRVLRVNEEMEKNINDYLLVFFTKNGVVKATPMNEYLKCRPGATTIVLDEGDSVCHVMTYRPERDSNLPLIYTKQGFGITINMSNVVTTTRITRGTQHLALEKDDCVQGVCATDCDELCVITMKGYGKRCGYNDMFKATKRKAAMNRITSLHEGDSVFRIIPVRENFNDFSLTAIMNDGSRIEVPFTEIHSTTRISKGDKLISVKRSESIVKLKINEI